MEPAQLLYLRFKLAQKDDYLDSQFQKRGFKLTKKTGTGIESFRNYHYEMNDVPEALDLSFKLMPGKNTTETVSLSLSPNIPAAQVEDLFSKLKGLAAHLPFNLLDLKLRNKIYEELHKEGKVDAFYTGLNEKEHMEVEKQAYIPLDVDTFLAQKTLALKGQRAPDLDL